MIGLEYIIDDKKSLLTIIFNNAVLHHLNAKCDDKLFFCQSLFDARLFSIVKADTGYRITRVPNKKKLYRISIGHRLSHLSQFGLTLCTYYMKQKGLIKIKLQ
jgi:hypothetical protein